MRKSLFFALATAILVPLARAQDAGDSFTLLSSQRQPVEVWVGAGFQQFTGEDELGISQLSIPVGARVPLGRNTQAQLTLSQASVSGDELTSLSGLSDAHLTVSHARQMSFGSLVASLGVGLPTGTSALESGEFVTSVEMGRNAYGFRVPGLGQGMTVAPSVVLAVPLGDDLVAGLGASYLYRGAYEPMAGMDAYDAGDEILVTAGLSLGVDRVSSLSADVSYTLYGTDTVDGEEVLASGAKTTALAQYRRLASSSRVHVYGLYRSRAITQYRIGAVLADDESRTPPSEMQLQGSYGIRLGGAFWAHLVGGTRLFGKTPGEKAMTLTQVGIMPEIRLSSRLSLAARALGTFGDLNGIEVGTRLTTRF